MNLEITKLFNDLEAKKNQFAELVGSAKTIVKGSELNQKDKDFIQEVISNAQQGKEISLEVINQRLKDINNASRSNNSK
jgi:hypothetical protein